VGLIRGLLGFVCLCGIRRDTGLAVARINQTAAAANELVVVFPMHRPVMNFHIRTLRNAIRVTVPGKRCLTLADFVVRGHLPTSTCGKTPAG
jgi:hypothetical protein